MDNRITKKRLNHMFSYEWIAIIALTVAVIVLWELCYSIFSVKLTPGQQFRVFYDYNVDGYQGKALLDLFETEDTFSYEVISKKHETLLKDSDVLYMRHEVGVSDALFTDVAEVSNEGSTVKFRRGHQIVDQYKMYSFDRLVKEAEEYLDTLKENGEFSDKKINDAFLLRNKKDNRFRSEKQKQEGFVLEKARIIKLADDVKFLKQVIELDKNNEESIFYSYKRYEESLKNATDENTKTYYQNLLANENTENYGLKLWMLKGGKKNVTTYFDSVLENDVSVKNLVFMVFDMKDKKKELQFELVSVTATLIRQFSNIAG